MNGKLSDFEVPLVLKKTKGNEESEGNKAKSGRGYCSLSAIDSACAATAAPNPAGPRFVPTAAPSPDQWSRNLADIVAASPLTALPS